MAKVLKKSPKKALTKTVSKKSQKSIVTSSENKPIKIILEIVFRNEMDISKSNFARPLELVDLPQISYIFNTNQITVLSLTIEDNPTVQRPDLKGTIQLKYIPLSGKISVSAMATGQGTGNLQLTYTGKNVFASPVSFNFTNGIGFINEMPKLP